VPRTRRRRSGRRDDPIRMPVDARAAYLSANPGRRLDASAGGSKVARWRERRVNRLLPFCYPIRFRPGLGGTTPAPELSCKRPRPRQPIATLLASRMNGCFCWLRRLALATLIDHAGCGACLVASNASRWAKATCMPFSVSRMVEHALPADVTAVSTVAPPPADCSGLATTVGLHVSEACPAPRSQPPPSASRRRLIPPLLGHG
jgi:hypothetical protein